MYLISHIEGRTRLKYQNLFQLHLFVKNTRHIPGLKTLEHNETTLTVLVRYEINSPLDYVLQNIVTQKSDLCLSKEDISAYLVPLLANPMTKAFWLILLFGFKVGFLQFAISSMIVNKYIKSKFD